MNRSYKAFISYSWSDKAWGGWLHRTLETYRTPRQLVGKPTLLGPAPATLHPIFKDREEEAAGHGIGAAIEAAMAASEFLIVICSPRSAKSEWVNREVAWFKRNKDKTRILALIVEGEPGASFIPGREAEECFPATLLYSVGADLLPTDILEDTPLAADARKEGDGKRGAKLKLAAAMLGVGLDELVRRDERRRTIRRRIVTLGAISLSAVMSTLALVAINQRDAAVKAEALAEAAQAEAEFQRDEAQDQVEWMLTDLRKRLDAVGRLDVLDAVGKRLLQSYEKQDIALLNPDALGRRARVQLLLGEVENTRGNLDLALAHYTEAAATTEELLRRAPDDPQRIFDHSQSVFWVGYIAWQRGDRPTAQRRLEQYHAQAERLVALDPTNDDWRAELMYALSNLGTLHMDVGEAEVAETRFRKARDLALSIYGEAPAAPEAVIELGQSFSWLAEATLHQGRVSAALEARRTQIALYQIDELDTNAFILQERAVASYAYAEALLAGGDVANAVSQGEAAVAAADRLLEADPENLDLVERSILARSISAEALMHAGDRSAAVREVDEALALTTRLMQSDDTVIRWKGKVGVHPALLRARLYELSADDKAAVHQYTMIVHQLGPLVAAGVPEPAVIRIYCSALAGAARLSSGNTAYWDRIIETTGARAARLGPRTRTTVIEALARRGELAQASAIAAPLVATGYRHPDFVALLPTLAPSDAFIRAAIVTGD